MQNKYIKNYLTYIVNHFKNLTLSYIYDVYKYHIIVVDDEKILKNELFISLITQFQLEAIDKYNDKITVLTKEQWPHSNFVFDIKSNTDLEIIKIKDKEVLVSGFNCPKEGDKIINIKNGNIYTLKKDSGTLGYNTNDGVAFLYLQKSHYINFKIYKKHITNKDLLKLL